MPKRRQINAGRGGARLRAAAAVATAPLRSLAWIVEERLLWRVADLLRKVVEVAKWPFERVAWLFERRLVWPLRERTAGRGPSGRIAGAGALGAVALGAAVLGVASLSGGGAEPISAPARVAVAPGAAPAATEKSAGPVLRGAPPSFEADGSGGTAAGTTDTDGSSSSSSTLDAETAIAAAPDAEAATTSSQKAVPAGPAAMKVARRFADAFVYYEVGEREERAKAIFAETATPQLEKALSERPPRQPASVEVPQARVLNLVPGPRRGKTYTVSASLLRVGTTSELRLEMARTSGSWLITDVRG